MNKFIIQCTSDKIWNLNELLQFLLENQNANIELKVNPEAVCLSNIGIYELLHMFTFDQVNICTYNPLESSCRYKIVHNNFDVWFRKSQKINKNLHNWNRTKIFYALFGRPTASRLGFGGYLLNNYADRTHLHFSACTLDDELVNFELDKLLQYRTSSIQEAGLLINHLPKLLSSAEKYTKYHGYDYNDSLTDFYQDIFVDLVVESHVAGNTFFPTEKTARAIWLKKPFIIFASKNYLDYLHQMGFKTFCNFWSEDYDGYEGRERFIKMLQLIDKLALTPIDDLEKKYWDMQYILDHNYNLLLNQNYKTKITPIL
jgi:hypothetical protein